MSVWEAIVLAIIEGLTEFLPVSSTGHMIIASSLMGIASDPFVKTFTIAIQLGTILSVVVIYWKRFFQSFDFYFKLLVAFIPAAVFGLLLNDLIDQMLERVEIVALMLVIGGVIFLFIDKWFAATEASGKSEVTYGTATKVGFFQVISVLAPGVSRSAATIIGGLASGLTKKSAAEFSFFLAVPTMFAATAYKLFKYYKAGNAFGQQELLLLAVGNVIGFVVTFVAIKSFIQFLTKHGFKFFGYYRIALGTIILILYFLGVQLSIV